MSMTLRSAVTAAILASSGAIAAQPQAEADQRLKAALDRSGEQVTITQLPNGTVKIELHDTFQHVALARIGSDGQLETLCAEHADHALQFINSEPESAAITVGEPE